MPSRPRSRPHLRLPALVLAGALVVAAGCGDDDAEAEDDASSTTTAPEPRPVSGGEPIGPADEGIDGVEAFEIESNDHTEDDLAYDPAPPTGGDHNQVPGNCGFYAENPPPDETLVHDLEHGAIWVAYGPEVGDDELDALRDLAGSEPKVVVTPYEGLDSPLVVTAWARQLPLDSVDDPRLEEFVEAYQSGGESPEPDAPCQGVGEPEVPSPS